MSAAGQTTRRGFAARTLALGAAALLGTALAGCGRSQGKAQPVPAGSTVLALGDSLTYGTGASAEASYPTVLAELTGWNVVNAGVPGDTSAQALARLPALLAEHRPKLVIVSIGGNDFLRKLPESDTRANVHAACKLALESGAQVLLVAVPRATVAAALGQMTDHALYAEVAKDLNIPLQREGWGEVLAQAELRSDQVHANAKGYAQFARSVQGTAAAAGLLPR
ncbi:arylesterase [Ottowia beijingensis]|uniref:Arylesterase n=1 Tax=Ottowia beijingensis TaxID=1207057 RepID=A0A853IQE8_9BURK|nr:GDSL-type esterase/lipase family protein [Ottowia beijingensis]NZA02823.1 arylesterase [Ottowia beijingensis]